jgi:hypothetical protein
MFRRILWMAVFVTACGVAGLAIPSTAEAWRGYGYYPVPITPYGYATAYGYAYPGAPYYQPGGPPYYQPGGPPYYQPGGPPYYPGYGPPYVGGFTMRGYTMSRYVYPRQVDLMGVIGNAQGVKRLPHA